MIGRPRIEPELSSRSVTTVSRKSVSFSCLNDKGCSGSTMTRVSREGSSKPSSRSNSQARFCCASNRRCSRLASRATTPWRVRQLLVEIAAQAVELFGLAQILGADGLVEFAGEGLVIGSARLVAMMARPPRLGGGLPNRRARRLRPSRPRARRPLRRRFRASPRSRFRPDRGSCARGPAARRLRRPGRSRPSGCPARPRRSRPRRISLERSSPISRLSSRSCTTSPNRAGR